MKKEKKTSEKIELENKDSAILKISEKETPLLEEKNIEVEDQSNSTQIKENINSLFEQKIIPAKSDEVLEQKNQVEAILFAAGKALDEKAIMELCSIEKNILKKALETLRKDYESRNCGLMLFQEGTTWKLSVREKYNSIVRKIIPETELARSTMETLAVIAWKTPIYQNEVVRIRGNKCYDHISELEESGLITKDKKGRSYILKTTEKFYNYFDIDNKNMQGILEEIKNTKIETEQKTLEDMDVVETKIEDKRTPEEILEDHKKDMLGKLEVVPIKRKEENPEFEENQKNFLSEIDKKIFETGNRTDELTSDLPSRNIIKDEIDIETDLNSNNIETEQKDSQNDQSQEIEITEQVQKPKTLTKKQLENKFKEDLLRAREKTNKK